MYKILRRLIFVIGAICISQKVHPQCNISTINVDNDLTLYKSNAEVLADGRYFVEDNSIVIPYLSCFFLSKNNGTSLTVGFELDLTYVDKILMFAPREVEIQFDDNTEKIKAESYGVLSPDNPLIMYYRYIIGEDLLVKLAHGNIKKINLTDTRINKTISYTPFNGIFKDQFICLGNILKK